MSACHNRLDRFSRNDAGAVSLVFALLALVFFSFIGVAVDYSRWSNMKGRTADALDAALLAGGRALQTQSSPEDAVAVARKNFEENAKKLQIINPQVTISVAADGQSLEGVAWAKMTTPFLGLLKTKSLKVAANAKVGFSIGAGSSKGGSDLEISLMLDVTGSMCDGNVAPCTSGAKIGALKAASADLVNIILQNAATSASARIALVPFSTRIVVGPPQDGPTGNLMKKLTNLQPKWTGWMNEWSGCSTWTPGGTSEDPGSGGSCTTKTPVHKTDMDIVPCLTDRTGPEEFTDAAPGSNAWLNGQEGGRRPMSWDSSDTPLAPGDGDGSSAAEASDQWNYNDWGGSCWDVDPANMVMPLTNDKDALLQRINSLVGYGATSGALGTAWAWYMISPNWDNIWNGQSKPGSYADTVPVGSNPPKLRKIAVLMTDGLYNAYRGWMGQDPVTVSNNAKSICTNMKAAGIEIYTVGFDLDSLPAAQQARAKDVLQTCGTDIQHFYDAINAEQLKQSFRDIALQLSQLFVAK